jgi:hypothetical protein
MDNLNQFELAILDRLSVDNPVIKKHIPFLRVRNREVTGVGMYVHFFYVNNAPSLDSIPKPYISTSGYLKMEGLKDGLIDDVNITDGKVDFLELVTYDEPWDGIIRNFFWTDKFN